MSIKNILVPIDFSENALNGLHVACQLGKKLDAQLHLVSAFHVPAPLTDVGGAPQVIGNFISDYHDEIEEKLEELEDYVPSLKEVIYDKDVYLANTIDAIYTAIENKSIDLIVMGTRKSHTGLEHLLGGVSTDVIRFAKCPVLVIPEEFRDFDPKRITLAVDNKSDENSRKLAVIEDLCRAYDASLAVVHVKTAKSMM